jgi:hypothetical protein
LGGKSWWSWGAKLVFGEYRSSNDNHNDAEENLKPLGTNTQEGRTA